MTMDWCPGIREACSHWRDAPMLQQNLEALDQTLDQNNDACIDCAKTIVEVVCRVIVESFHSSITPLKPVQETPSLSDWLSAAVRALKLGDIRDEKFKKLVSSHHKLATALNDLRNQAGPASHGKDPYLERLAIHHRRSAVLAADAIVAFLHKAYLDTQLDPANSREPWERFSDNNAFIDTQVGLSAETDDDGLATLQFLLPGGEVLPVTIEVSRLLYQLTTWGYNCTSDNVIGPDGKQPERDAGDEVVLKDRLKEALAKLNPALPTEAQADALRRITQSELPNLLEENRRIHRLLTEGADVEYYAEDGVLTAGKAIFIDFERPERNDWLAVQQFNVVAGQYRRRPDVVVFVNGLPLAVIELKAPGGENATLSGAFNQLQTYKQQIPALFRCNALLVTSDGLNSRVGSLSADLERFMPWRTTDGRRIEPKGTPEQDILVEGVFEQSRLLDLLRHFTVFSERGDGLIKIIAGYHQFHAVKKAVASTLRASQADHVAEDPAEYNLPGVDSQPLGDRKAGVIWHTQGSGKSLLMAFYAGLLVYEPRMKNPTLVVLTDRNDLDDQLFATFASCRDLIRQTPIQATGRDHLCDLLQRASGGVIFTTLQKFGEVEEALTTRSNVVVIADEAHRSQYGFRAKVDANTGVVSYGFAKYLRDALPYASFIGFTGTPIEATDVNTPAVFGHYIDIYDISRAVEDGATVPIYYESRLARIELDEDEKPCIDAEIEALLEDEEEPNAERTKQKWSTVEALVGSDKRLSLVA